MCAVLQDYSMLQYLQ